jgi:hypothetical protein
MLTRSLESELRVLRKGSALTFQKISRRVNVSSLLHQPKPKDHICSDFVTKSSVSFRIPGFLGADFTCT